MMNEEFITLQITKKQNPEDALLPSSGFCFLSLLNDDNPALRFAIAFAQ